MDVDLGQHRFGALLRSSRVRRGLTQLQLADLSTVSVRTIRDLEMGRVRRPRRDTVRLIADGLGLTGRARARFAAAARWPGDGERHNGSDPPDPPPAELIGREADLAVLPDLLAAGAHRLDSLIGDLRATLLVLERARFLHRERQFAKPRTAKLLAV
jgi:transcriptional regulator with XRE-family HTH domain